MKAQINPSWSRERVKNLLTTTFAPAFGIEDGGMLEFIVLRTAAQGKTLERMTELESVPNGKELLDIHRW